MRNGDISNQIGSTIGFRCMDFLVKYRDTSITDKVLNFIAGKYKRAVIDSTVRSYMEYLYRDTEYTVDLVIESKDYTDDMKLLLDDLPFNRIVVIDKPSQISQRLLIGDLTLYVDEDTYRLSLINSPYAVPFDKINDFIKRRGRTYEV